MFSLKMEEEDAGLRNIVSGRYYFLLSTEVGVENECIGLISPSS